MLDTLEEAVTYQGHYESRVKQAAFYIRKRILDANPAGLTFTPGSSDKPVFGLTLGSGLGDLVEEIESPTAIHFRDIPYFPIPTVEGHEGIMYLGRLQGVPIIGLKGRTHYYEVADKPFNTGMLDVSFAVNVLAELGVPNYFATNAAGGLNQNYQVGDLMIIKSHIMLIPNPLLGRKHTFDRVDDGKQTWRFTPLNTAYDKAFRNMLRNHKRTFPHSLHDGIYLAVTGPTYETAAECLAFRDGFKADAVGMSTSPEVIVATNRGMRTVGMSIITNKIAADGTNATNHEEVMATLKSTKVKERLQTVVRGFFKEYRRQFA